jgi:hypothetical protein
LLRRLWAWLVNKWLCVASLCTWVARSGTCLVMNAIRSDERQKSYNETSLVMSAKREVHQPLMKAVFGDAFLRPPRLTFPSDSFVTSDPEYNLIRVKLVVSLMDMGIGTFTHRAYLFVCFYFWYDEILQIRARGLRHS